MSGWQMALWGPFLIGATVAGIGVAVDSSDLRRVGLGFGLVTFVVLIAYGIVRLFQWP